MRSKAKALSGDFQEFLDECIGTDAKIGPFILPRRIIAEDTSIWVHLEPL